MTDRPGVVNASTLKEWIASLEAIVADDPDEVAPGNQERALALLLALYDVGMRAGAVRPLVTHSSGPRGFAHLSYRFLLVEAFDWSGTISLAPEPGASTPERLVAAVETATGIAAPSNPVLRD
jgi:hypothetical protein